LKIQVFWEVTTCNLQNGWRSFELAQCFHLHSHSYLYCVNMKENGSWKRPQIITNRHDITSLKTWIFIHVALSNHTSSLCLFLSLLYWMKFLVYKN